MNAALWISKTGLDAQQTSIDITANNLANASTVGHKRNRAVFENLLYQTVRLPGGQSATDTELPTGLMKGVGAKVVATQRLHSQGNVKTTENALDLMIDGRGFFEVALPDGTIAYTRNGEFTLNSDGNIVTPGTGYVLQPPITLTDDAQDILVGDDGTVTVRIEGDAAPQNLGQISMSVFVNPMGLLPIEENLYLETLSSGAPQQGVGGADGFGSIEQGMLETSNVNVSEELVNLIQSQRIYEMNSKVISSVDQMLGFITQQL